MAKYGNHHSGVTGWWISSLVLRWTTSILQARWVLVPFYFTALSIFLKFTVKYSKQPRGFFGPFIFRTFLFCVVSFYSFPHSISLPLFEHSSCPSDNKQTCTGMIHDTWKVVTPNSPVKNKLLIQEPRCSLSHINRFFDKWRHENKTYGTEITFECHVFHWNTDNSIGLHCVNSVPRAGSKLGNRAIKTKCC